MSAAKSPLRGSVTQNNVSARVREQDGIGFLARLGLLAGLLVLLLIAAIIGWRSGWVSQKIKEVHTETLDLTQKAQFEINDIVVEGRVHSGKDAISDALGIKQGTPILSVDLEGAATRLNNLPWVKEARVERHLPDTIEVYIKEREPLARWQKNERFYVIDTEGKVLSTADAKDFPSLPQVVGAGADREARKFLEILNNYPDIRDKTDAAVRVSERRWDLHLSPKIVVRLPETNVGHALHRLSVLMTEEKILERNIVAIDLRMPDRLVLEPAESPKLTGEKRS